MSYHIASDDEWRISKSGYSIKTGFADNSRIVASYHAPHTPFDGPRFERWIKDAQHACDLHNASLGTARADTRIAELEKSVTIRDTEIARLETDLELARLKASEQAAENASLLRLLADIRFALGDNGRRMQPELVEWCKELRADAERYRWLRANATGKLGAELFGQSSPSYIDSRIDAALPYGAARAGNGGEG